MGRTKNKARIGQGPGGRGGKSGGPSKGGRDGEAWETSAEDRAANQVGYPAKEAVNEAFEEYYKGQGIMGEEEWPLFMASLRKDLPTTFRVTGSRAHAQVINDIILKTHVPHIQNISTSTDAPGSSSEPVPAPFQIPWFPLNLAWQIDAPKRVIRKYNEYKVFQRFLVGETEGGNVSRQEAVSMIPPLLLDVRPEHYCLDMCAAPGSKTAQILEALNPPLPASELTGLLIANDADAKRCHMLVHQTGRMPSAGLCVTNWDASMFPNIKLDKKGTPLMFDRILADVPCSGDGTLRKNGEIWKDWNANNGTSLHLLQIRILLRGMQNLKPGGRIVYSTCSFNPIENEAVVAAAMNTFPGVFRLVPQEQSEVLPLLKRRPGLQSWKVANQEKGTKNVQWWETKEEFDVYLRNLPQAQIRGKKEVKEVPASCWPPANAGELGLEHCLRMLPHDQDTGGFFVCVLEKSGTSLPNPLIINEDKPRPKRALSPSAPEGPDGGEKKPKLEEASGEVDAAMTEDVKPAPEAEAVEVKQEVKQNGKAKAKDVQFKEDPFTYLKADDADVESCMQWFGLKPTFRRENCLVRNATGIALRAIYLSNDVVKSIVTHNDYVRLRLVSAGIRVFMRQDTGNKLDLECRWRIPSEGLHSIMEHLETSKIITVELDVLRKFMETPYPMTESFGGAFGEKMMATPAGCHIIRVEPGEGAGGKVEMTLTLPTWKAKHSLSLMLDKKEKSMACLRIFGEDLCPAPSANELQHKPATIIPDEEEANEVDIEAALLEEEEAMNNL